MTKVKFISYQNPLKYENKLNNSCFMSLEEAVHPIKKNIANLKLLQ